MTSFTHLVEDTDEPEILAAFACFQIPAAPGTVCLMMVGELDLVTADRAQAAIRRAQNETRALTCDLGDVWFVDLSGLRVLVDATAHAKLTGGRLTIDHCPPIVPRMLRLLGLEHALELRSTSAAAVGVTPRCDRFRRSPGRAPRSPRS